MKLSPEVEKLVRDEKIRILQDKANQLIKQRAKLNARLQRIAETLDKLEAVDHVGLSDTQSA